MTLLEFIVATLVLAFAFGLWVMFVYFMVGKFEKGTFPHKFQEMMNGGPIFHDSE